MFLGPSNTAGKVESAFLFAVGAAVVLLVIVTICMIVFLILYNHTRHPRPARVEENVLLEVVWTVIPTVLVVVMFYFGWVDFDYIRNPPPNAMPVNVVARQWSWLFQYRNGKQSDVLNVPQGVPVELLMTSRDVLHCLFIPAFRIKEDCVPGMTTHLWFTANEAGSYEVFCTEYCGVGHSHMRSTVIVMPASDFYRWYDAAEAMGIGAEGFKTVQAKGCLACHSIDGTRKVGPTFKGLWGRTEKVVRGGVTREVTVDEVLIRDEILHPNADVVEGYPPVMPTIPVTDKELAIILRYLKTLQ